MEKTAGLTDSTIAANLTARLFSGQDWTKTPVCVPSELPLTIFVNQQEVVTILCTPTKLNCLVLGFLYSEGVIADVREVASMRICEDEPVADVRLTHAGYKVPPKRTLTSGCGSGASFNNKGQKVESDLVISAGEVLALMRQLYQQQELFQQCGGVHASALCDRKQILVSAEDIGRHNTLDKILGECLLKKQSTRDGILLTTGRISSEMLVKAARMQTPVVVSRGSPTERAVRLGQEFDITVIGYARSNRLTVFSGEKRVEGAGD
ncbi:MAG: formate dehydrogenase accessory sulfurtransferase FdhD [Dehalococcoidales bacterium]|nr:formate dehydrogenase accessory sulfurtransferase FdhD [Dehalococcoidales bacterium]